MFFLPCAGFLVFFAGPNTRTIHERFKFKNKNRRKKLLMCETVKLTFPGGFLGMKRNGFFFCEEVFF